MEGRRSSYRSLASLQRDNRRCRACALAGFPLESRPVVEGHAGQAAFMLGQAPGPVEGVEGTSVAGSGRADAPSLARARGRGVLRDVLLRVGDALRPRPRAVGPRRPQADAGGSRQLCEFWLDSELGCSAAISSCTVGGLASRRLLGLSDLTAAIGEHFRHGEATVVPLPHPSGASGWLNDAANRGRLEGALDAAAARARGSPASRRRSDRALTCPKRTRPRAADLRPTGPSLQPKSAPMGAGFVPKRTAASLRSDVPYRRTFVRLLGFLRPYRASLVVSTVLAIVSQGAAIASSSSPVRDQRARWAQRTDPIALLVGTIIVVGAVKAPLMVGRRLISGRQALGVEYDCATTYAQLVRLSFGFYDRHETGQFMSRATVDLQAVRFFLGYGLIFFAQHIVTIVAVTSSSS